MVLMFVWLVGETPTQSSLILKTGETADFNERDLCKSEIWLRSEKNEILDFRSQLEWQY